MLDERANTTLLVPESSAVGACPRAASSVTGYD
jgi:hypothetical protein